MGEECWRSFSWLGSFRTGNDSSLLREITQKLLPTGARPQPRVHFQRRALRLPENTSYSDLTAFLTAASSPSEVDSFPYLRGLDGNGTGDLRLFLDGPSGVILSVSFGRGKRWSR